MWNVAVMIVGLLVGWAMPVAAANMEMPGVVAAPEEMSHTVTGGFVSYVPEDQEVTVLDDNGEELIFTVDPNVLPVINGQPAAFDQLRAGDRLTLTVVDDENGDEYVMAIQAARAPGISAAP